MKIISYKIIGFLLFGSGLCLVGWIVYFLLANGFTLRAFGPFMFALTLIEFGLISFFRNENENRIKNRIQIFKSNFKRVDKAIEPLKDKKYSVLCAISDHPYTIKSEASESFTGRNLIRIESIVSKDEVYVFASELMLDEYDDFMNGNSSHDHDGEPVSSLVVSSFVKRADGGERELCFEGIYQCPICLEEGIFKNLEKLNPCSPFKNVKNPLRCENCYHFSEQNSLLMNTIGISFLVLFLFFSSGGALVGAIITYDSFLEVFYFGWLVFGMFLFTLSGYFTFSIILEIKKILCCGKLKPLVFD